MKMEYSEGDELIESGVDWIGQVPSHWDTVKVRFVARLESGHTPSRSVDEYWENCDIPWVTTSDIKKFRGGQKLYLENTVNEISELGLENSGARLLPKGTVFLSRTASVGFAGIMGQDMATSQDFANWVCGDDVLPEYLVYVFRSMDQEFSRLMQGSTHQTIYMPDIRSLEMPLPPVPEQERIVSYLKEHLSTIDSILNDKMGLVERLDQKRHAEITTAITEGIRPDAKTVNTNNDWFSEVPEHWDIMRLKRLRKRHIPIVYGIVQPGPDQDEGIPYIKGGQCEPEKLDPELLSKTTPEIAEKYERSRLNEGELVYEIRGSVGRVVEVPPELDGANLTQDTARISPREGINTKWLLYALRSQPFFQQMEVNRRGATVEGVNLFDLRRGLLPVPPEDEQVEIASYLSEVDENISKVKRAVEQSIDLLKEEQQSLTKAVVTGDINVEKVQSSDKPRNNLA
ncbi:restriction endonuclease subunit S [Haloferax massiliensis]|uniref:EcoKI restriction-modification system protein HsdS n=1 Tax=Haloferax massiliensis TaxID=1476858 RepID=A0A0D6JN50_9EURY|nr:restriction endonuclease subunit S [Haloferax massiliensis]CQR49028.1 EcoKI restriction-modification system protein HsdS [Haloferax massiliensis]